VHFYSKSLDSFFFFPFVMLTRFFSSSTRRNSIENEKLIRTCSLRSSQNILDIQWNDGDESSFHGMWLRDSCRSMIDHGTNQKLYSVISYPKESTVIENASLRSEGKELFIRWKEGYVRESSYPSIWLWKHCSKRKRFHAPTLSSNNNLLNVPRIHYSEVVSSENHIEEEGLYKWIKLLITEGLCLVEEVPTTLGTVMDFGESISPVMHTLYGKIFDVQVEEKPINIAYSNQKILPHVDLNYYESPPGVQFLHCVAFDERIQGGESTFVDALALAEKLREVDPLAFTTLSTLPTSFQKDHMQRQLPAQMFYSRPIISVNHRNEVIGVNWSPPFEGPPHIDSSQVEEYYRAYQSFHNLINPTESNPFQIKFRLRPGDCITFLQRRILHGRESFTSGVGKRHLQGCYLNIDDVLSRFLSLHRKLKGEDLYYYISPLPRIGNNDYS
jgi:alpha-ketoglutarate-dependent taurine dioxygenase